jgi:prepilin-type N-terminal cleavage/methylation domain-containing protein
MSRSISNPSQRGFTLIELMVSLTVLAILIALSVRMATTVLNGYRSQRQTTAALRASRASLDILTDAVRNASAGVPSAQVKDAAGCTELDAISVVNGDDAPDELTLIYASGGVVTSLRTALTGSTTAFTVADATGLSVGDRLLVTDFETGRVVAVNSLDDVTGGVSVGTIAPITACPSIGVPGTGYAAGSLVVRAKVSRFYIDDVAGTPTLMMDPDGDGSAAAEPLAEGVEDLQVAVGVDVDGDGEVTEDGTTTDEWFYNADGDSAPPAITTTPWRALRITVVARTLREPQVADSSTPPAVEDHTAGQPDRYRRRVLSTTIEIRNLEGSP